MMTPGAALLKFRQKFGHGLHAAYYRDIVRSKILSTPAVKCEDQGDVEIHVLTSAHDWLNLIWTLKSFNYVAGFLPRLCVHEDGSLNSEAKAEITKHFPDARLVSRSEADTVLERFLEGRPRSKAFRNSNPLALKVFDFVVYLSANRMLLLDCDILFFKKPKTLIERCFDPDYEFNTLNRDWQWGYSIDNSVLDSLIFKVPPLINSGLGLIHKHSFELDGVEEYLALPDILSHSHRIEQTLIALYSSKHGFEFLPEEYDVHLGPIDYNSCCRHFTGPIRHRMYSEGMRYLVKHGMLDA